MRPLKFVLFYHSMVSDWNNGNAHFLRGVVKALRSRRQRVEVYEPRRSWSFANLVSERGSAAVRGFRRAYPGLCSHFYDVSLLDLDAVLDGADVVIVHEWNEPGLVARLGAHRERTRSYRLFFHDTHHRSATDPDAMRRYDLRGYDGVLAFGAVVREAYLRRAWAERAWVWHEAADVELFTPPVRPAVPEKGDLVWIGNWGDEERTAEIQEFLIRPVAATGLDARVYGVRYPEDAILALQRAGIGYEGWLPNYEVPAAFARHRMTVHVPRGPYARELPGIPTIRVFEALACGIPLLSAPWDDCERLFEPGDFLMVRNAAQMTALMQELKHDMDFAARVAEHGRATVLARHTCEHRVDELLALVSRLNAVTQQTALTRTGTGTA